MHSISSRDGLRGAYVCYRCEPYLFYEIISALAGLEPELCGFDEREYFDLRV
jgi:hypothetical protein